MTAIQGTLYSETVDTKTRFTRISIAQSLGAAISGGMAPFVATVLLATYNNSWVPIAMYLTCLYFMNNITKRKQENKNYFKIDREKIASNHSLLR